MICSCINICHFLVCIEKCYCYTIRKYCISSKYAPFSFNSIICRTSSKNWYSTYYIFYSFYIVFFFCW